MGHPNQHYVGRTLTPDAVISKDFFGGRNHFFARKYPSLGASARAFDRQEFVIRIADELDEIGEILHWMAVHGLDHLPGRIAISLRKLVRKERRGDVDYSLAGEFLLFAAFFN